MESVFKKEVRGGLLAQLMAFVAGFVDAIGYIVLFHMFTANMSGNSVALGIYIGQQRWSEILHRAFPIPFFMLGVVIGSFLIVLLNRRGARAFPVVFLLEAALISLFCLLGEPWYSAFTRRIESPRFYAIAALPPVAMGLQTALLHRVGNLSLRTTFVTGMISSSCRELVNYLFWLKDQVTEKGIKGIIRLSSKEASFFRMLLPAGIWILYMAGAVVSGSVLAAWGLRSLFIPVLVLLFAVVLVLLKPIRNEDRTL